MPYEIRFFGKERIPGGSANGSMGLAAKEVLNDAAQDAPFLCHHRQVTMYAIPPANAISA